MSAWLVYFTALVLIVGFSVLAGKCIAFGLGSPQGPPNERWPSGPPGRPALTLLHGDDAPLLSLVDERRSRAALYPVGDIQAVWQRRPTPYSDGTFDETTFALDVIADLAAAPGSPPDAA